MGKLNYEKVLLSLTVEIPDSIYERHSPFAPHLLAQEITDYVETFVISEALGYYPALDYLKEEEAIPEALFEALDQLAWLSSSTARSELMIKLRPLYASVQVKSMQVIAYNMPVVRFGQPNMMEKLIRHYTPNRVKADLLITLMNKTQNNETLAEYVKISTWRNLEDVFESFEINAATLITVE